MMGRFKLFRQTGGAAAAELALITPLLLTLLFGSVELGNYFVDEHALVKHVRDGARFASRMPLEDNYTCPNTVDPAAVTTIGNVVRTGTVDGTGTGRFDTGYWDRSCPGTAATVDVTIRCVAEDEYEGIWTELPGDIPVVTVSAAVQYRSLLDTLGLGNPALCLRAESEIPVMGS